MKYILLPAQTKMLSVNFVCVLDQTAPFVEPIIARTGDKIKYYTGKFLMSQTLWLRMLHTSLYQVSQLKGGGIIEITLWRLSYREIICLAHKSCLEGGKSNLIASYTDRRAHAFNHCTILSSIHLCQ